MSTDFLGKINELQAQFNEYRRQADEVRAANGSRSSAAEGELRVKAANAAKQLAQMTDGAIRSKYDRLYREQKEMAQMVVEDLEKQAEVIPSGEEGRIAETNRKPSPREGSVPEKGGDSSSASWYREKPKQGFDDVTGMQEVKDRLQGIVNRMKRKSLMEYLKINRLNGFLFYGPPGCGKTFLTEAFVHELMGEDYHYLSLDAKDIHSKYSGESEKIVGAVFEEAEKAAPSLVFFDEMDAVCTDRQQPDIPQHTKSLTDAFLTAYNHLKSSDAQVFLIGATNYPQNVDPAMISRMELIRIPLPDEKARAFFFSHSFEEANLHMAQELNASYMAARTDHYSYRDLEHLVRFIKERIANEVMHLSDEDAIRELKAGKHPVTKEGFDEAYRTVLPAFDAKYMKSLEKWEEDKGIRASHTSQGMKAETGTVLQTSYEAGIGFNNHPFTDILFAYRFSEKSYPDHPVHRAENVNRVMEVKREIDKAGLPEGCEDRPDAALFKEVDDIFYKIYATSFSGFKEASFLHSYDGFNTGAQGSADERYHGTCGIVASCNIVNQQTGKRLSEMDGLQVFVKNDWCTSGCGPGENGGTDYKDRSKFFQLYGIESFVYIRPPVVTDARLTYVSPYDMPNGEQVPAFSLEMIIDELLNGWSVMASVNPFDLSQKELADRRKPEHRQANHVVTIAGCSMDLEGSLIGLWVNDTGRWTDSNRVFIPVEKWYQMVEQTDGFKIAYEIKGDQL